MTNTQKGRIALIASMCIFGTIGILRKFIDLPSGTIALARAWIGTAFLLCVVLLRREKPDWAAISKNALRLLVSGTFIGFNWVLLFESYRYTSVAAATLCYYMAPILMILAAPFLFKEALTRKQLLCVAAAVVGVVLVSGILQTGFGSIGELRGILLGLGAAVLYASVVLLNRTITGISAYYKTICQLGIAGIVLIPYVLLTEAPGQLTFTPLGLGLLLVAGILHTGLAYAMYFGSIQKLKTRTVALYSYIDPILAVILSALVLQEPMTISGAIGAVLILGAAFLSEK